MPNKQIKAVIKEFDNHLEGICFVDDGKYSQDDDGINYDITEEMNELKAFLKSKLQETYEAGQKSREKEIVEILQSVETIAEDEQKHHFTEHCPCLRYAIYKVENPDTEEMAYASSIKSLSLTKESK